MDARLARTTGFEPVEAGSTSRCLRPLGDTRAMLARSRGLKPRSSGVVFRRSIQLSYERVVDLLPRRPGSPPAREERGLETEPATELGVTCGSRTRGLQSHILAFSPPELTPPRTGASGSSRTNKTREERRVYRALSSPLPVLMRITSHDGHSCFPSCRRLPPPLPAACSLGQSPRLRIERSEEPGVLPA